MPSIEVAKYNYRAEVVETKWVDTLEEAAKVMKNWNMSVKSVHDTPSDKNDNIGFAWRYGQDITSRVAEILCKMK
jgi:hypothetical protein